MTLRTEAGDSEIGNRRDRCRDPIGSPLARYESTMRRKISRAREFEIGQGARFGAGLVGGGGHGRDNAGAGGRAQGAGQGGLGRGARRLLPLSPASLRGEAGAWGTGRALSP